MVIYVYLLVLGCASSLTINREMKTQQYLNLAFHQLIVRSNILQY